MFRSQRADERPYESTAVSPVVDIINQFLIEDVSHAVKEKKQNASNQRQIKISKQNNNAKQREKTRLRTFVGVSNCRGIGKRNREKRCIKTILKKNDKHMKRKPTGILAR